MGMTHTVNAPAAGHGHWRMPLFILASIMLHVAVLSQQNGTQAPLVLGEQTPLRVTLQQQVQPVQQVASDRPATIVPVTQRETVRAPAAVTHTLPMPTDKAPTEPVATTPSPAPSAEDSLVALRSPLSARVGIELARHFHYPAIAQRRGWQGIVLLGFRVSMDGNIEAIHIARSSGHTLLDRAAIGALGKVQRIMLDDHTLPQALDLQLPVIYRLENS